jgi:hypothetical protein
MRLKSNKRQGVSSLLTSLTEQIVTMEKIALLSKVFSRRGCLLSAAMFMLLMVFAAGVLAQRNYGFSNLFAKPIVLDAFGIIKRQLFSVFENPEVVKIDINYKNYMKLKHVRHNAIKAGTIYGIENKWVSVALSSRGEKYKAKIQLKGATADEHMMSKKWSFKVKLKEKKHLFGMRRFVMMSPMRRNLLGQWFIRKVFEKEGLITRKYEFVKLVINGKTMGIYVIDERYDKIMLERNNRKEGVIVKVEQSPLFVDQVLTRQDRDHYYMSMDYTAFNLKKILANQSTRDQFLKAKTLMEQFRLGSLTASQLFDLDLLAKWTAVSDVFGAWHGFGFANMRFYYNPLTSKFEPVPDDDYNERSYNYAADFRLFRLNDQYNNSVFLRNLFSDKKFVRIYLKHLSRIAQVNYLDSQFERLGNEVGRLSNILAADYPLYSFLLDSKKNTYANASSLRRTLKVHKGIQAYAKQIKEGKPIELMIANNHTVPIEVLSVGPETDGTEYTPLFDKEIILNGREYLRPVDYQLLKFGPLQGSESQIGQNLKLIARYRVLGAREVQVAEVFPYREFTEFSARRDTVRAKPNVDDFPFLVWNMREREIHFKAGRWQISRDLIIPKGQMVYVNEGTDLDLINSAMILSESPMFVVGSESRFVKIFSSDKTGQGVTLLNTTKDSFFKFVKFSGLSRPDMFGVGLSGSINFYQSPVHFFEAHFDGNIKGDDYLNIVRSDFSINRSKVENSYSDAIDIDFSKGEIVNSVFLNCGFGDNNGDCIDLSGSVVEIDNIIVDGAADKGISAGERTLLTINKGRISGAKFAIASKDISKVMIESLTVLNSKVGLSVFQKKREFGPAFMEVDGLEMDSVSTPYAIENGSQLVVDSKIVQ